MEAARDPLPQALRLLVVLISVVSFFAAASAAAEIPPAPSQTSIYPLLFPVEGPVHYSDTWGAPRSDGRTHKGADIFAPKGTPVLAAATGIVMRIAVGERAGRYIVVEHVDGWRSYYLHLDNDTPGTDDGRGGQPAPGITVGARVEPGDVLDFVGDSGNAEETPSHLHFELHRPDGDAINPTPHLRMAATAVGSHTPGTERSNAVRAPTHQAANTQLIGRFDPGGGFAAGLAVHNEIAYVGTWGRPDACPASGVRVIDVSDPATPTGVGVFASGAEFPQTSTDSVWVGDVATPSFTGTLAIVTVRLCDTSERNRRGNDFRGLAIYDVSAPDAPQLLASIDSGHRTQGVHEVDAAQRSDGSVLVAATVMQSFLHTDGEIGDLRVIDVTNPEAPTEVADWDFRRDGPVASDQSDQLQLHAHSVWMSPEGRSVWVAAWDAGLIELALDEPNAPRVVGRAAFGTNAEGNAHSVAFDPESKLLIRADEDLGPSQTNRHEPGWGGLTVYDASDPTSVIPLATFLTENASGEGETIARNGFFTAHEVVTAETTAFVSWYSDGLRVVDLAEPTGPVEVASFTPAPATDPQRYWRAPDGTEDFAMVWGVAVADNYVYLTDMNSGLWIVGLTIENPADDPVDGTIFAR